MRHRPLGRTGDSPKWANVFDGKSPAYVPVSVEVPRLIHIEVLVSRSRFTLAAAAAVAVLGCSESTATNAAIVAAPSESARAAAVSLDDAAQRAASALEDQSVAAELRGELGVLAKALTRGDQAAAARAHGDAAATLARYAARAPNADAVDRDVIALALDVAARALNGAP
jgi:hypothetical protein